MQWVRLASGSRLKIRPRGLWSPVSSSSAPLGELRVEMPYAVNAYPSFPLPCAACYHGVRPHAFAPQAPPVIGATLDEWRFAPFSSLPTACVSLRAANLLTSPSISD